MSFLESVTHERPFILRSLGPKRLAAPTTLSSHPPYKPPSSRNPVLCVLDSPVIFWEGMAVAYGWAACWVPPRSLELSLSPAPSLPQPLSLFPQSMVTVCVSKWQRATEEPRDLRTLADSNYFAGDKADSEQSGSLAKNWGRSGRTKVRVSRGFLKLDHCVKPGLVLRGEFRIVPRTLQDIKKKPLECS